MDPGGSARSNSSSTQTLIFRSERWNMNCELRTQESGNRFVQEWCRKREQEVTHTHTDTHTCMHAGTHTHLWCVNRVNILCICSVSLFIVPSGFYFYSSPSLSVIYHCCGCLFTFVYILVYFSSFVFCVLHLYLFFHLLLLYVLRKQQVGTKTWHVSVWMHTAHIDVYAVNMYLYNNKLSPFLTLSKLVTTEVTALHRTGDKHNFTGYSLFLCCRNFTGANKNSLLTDGTNSSINTIYWLTVDTDSDPTDQHLQQSLNLLKKSQAAETKRNNAAGYLLIWRKHWYDRSWQD